VIWVASATINIDRRVGSAYFHTKSPNRGR
jgi:hypothetical protein